MDKFLQKKTQNNKYKILFIQPGKGIGGSKLSLLDIVKNLNNTHSVQIVLSENEPEFDNLILPFVEKIHYIFLPDWTRKKNNSFLLKIKLILYRFIKKNLYLSIFRICLVIHREKINLIHTNNSMTLSGAIAAKIMHKKHIWHIREALGEEGQFLLGKNDNQCFSLINKLSNEIICNSEFTANPFQKYSIFPKIITNGIELQAFDDEAKNRGMLLRKSLGIPDNNFAIGMIGSIHSSMKEHTVFLKACEIIEKNNLNVSFLIFGGSKTNKETEYSKNLILYIQEIGLSNQMKIVGYIDDIPAMMYSLDVMVHPTSKEGSGRVVMEAMAAGVPVVGVRSGGIKELIRNGITGYLAEPTNHYQIAEFTQKLIEDEQLRKKMSVKSKKQSLNFSKELLIDRVNQIYQSLEKQ